VSEVQKQTVTERLVDDNDFSQVLHPLLRQGYALYAMYRGKLFLKRGKKTIVLVPAKVKVANTCDDG